MSNRHPFAPVVFVFSGLCLLIGLIAGLLLVLDHGQLPPAMRLQYLPAAGVVLVALGFCGIMLGIVGLLEKEPGMPRRLQKQLESIEQTLQVVGRTIGDAPAISSATMPVPPALPAASLPSLDHTSLDRLAALLEEIRDTSLMSESQRQTRLQQLVSARRNAEIAKADELIRGGRWREADAVLTVAEAQFSGDEELQASRQRYLAALATAEKLAFHHVRQAVQDQIALSAWDRAVEMANGFVMQFPGSAAGQELLQRLERQRQEYLENMAQELYEEVRANIEQRSWRRAHDAAQRLLAKYPEHHRAGTIKSQMSILKENADTEQRNAMEARIQDMIRGKRFDEAIELAEQLKAAFPNSAQAKIAQQLIEKLQLRAQPSSAA